MIVAITGEGPLFNAGKGIMFPVPLAPIPMVGVLFVHEYVVFPTVLMVEKIIGIVFIPLHKIWSEGSFTCPVGFTVIVKVREAPIQVIEPFSKNGVTMIVAITGAVPLFMAVKGVMFPVPLAPRPMLVVLFVHVYVLVPPVFTVLKVTESIEPLHTTWLAGGFICPLGLTVMVKVFVGPVQVIPPKAKAGVTTIVAINGKLLVFTATKEGIFPVPFAARPMVEALFVQEYVVVPSVLIVEKVTAVVI